MWRDEETPDLRSERHFPMREYPNMASPSKAAYSERKCPNSTFILTVNCPVYPPIQGKENRLFHRPMTSAKGIGGLDFLIAHAPLIVCHSLFEVVIEDAVKGQHFHSFAGRGIDVFLYGDKGNTERRIDYLRQTAHLDLLTAKAGYILYDNRPDLSVLRHSLHPLKIRPLKSCPGNAVVYKENRVQMPMFFSVVQ